MKVLAKVFRMVSWKDRLARFGSIGCVVAAAAAAAVGASPARAADIAASTIKGGLYGDVALVKPAGPMRGFVVLFSGADGWQHANQQAAETLARNGAMVVGVDTPRYAAKLATTREDNSGCHYLVGDAEAVAHQLQREAHSDRYFLPILVGVGQGGIVAERTLARAPSNTLAGAVTLDADTQLDPRFNPCAPDPTISRGKGLPGFFVSGAVARTTPAAASGAVVASSANAASAAAATGAAAATRFAAGTTQADALLALVGPHLLASGEREDDVTDLPLVALPAAQPTDMLAVVISGDGGWRDLDKTIAESLQKRGVSVVGVDALRYFWSLKTPQQASHDIARVLQVYGTRWHSRHIALIGYSFGADVMPFIYNRLPDALRAKVSLVSLLGFAPTADFQIRVTGWLGLPASDKALPVLPETASMPTALLQCFYGKEEEDSACPALAKRGVTVVQTGGGHHFGGDYDDLAQTILTRWRAQIAASGG